MIIVIEEPIKYHQFMVLTVGIVFPTKCTKFYVNFKENMSSSSKRDSEFFTEFLEDYKQLPALWNKKIQAYYNSTTKMRSYMLLLKKYREKYPNATMDDMKKKIAFLRCKCRRYYRNNRVDPKTSKHYLKEMYFIMESEDAEKPPDDEVSVETTYLELKSDSLDAEMSVSDSNDDQYVSEEEVYLIQASETDAVADKIEDAIPKQTTQSLYNMTETNHTNTVCRTLDDQHWWQWMSAEFEKLDPVQQLIAKKAITDVLLVGRQGLLTAKSVKITASDVRDAA